MMMREISKKIRKHVLKMMYESKSSHIGGCFSVVEILVTLYYNILKIDPNNPNDPKRDRLFLSKAHSSPTLYSILAERGFFPLNFLETYYKNGGKLPGHLDKESVPGIEHSMGSLGHGLSVGVGVSFANIKSGNPGRVFVILGDGECNEGSVWEAVMFASHHKLSNLTAVIDYNKIQSFGSTNEVINQEPILQRWKSFGWDAIEIDGHNHDELFNAFQMKQNGPKAIIAHTIKGKGVSFMENSLDWHYKSPTKEQYEQALEELDEN